MARSWEGGGKIRHMTMHFMHRVLSATFSDHPVNYGCPRIRLLFATFVFLFDIFEVHLRNVE